MARRRRGYGRAGPQAPNSDPLLPLLAYEPRPAPLVSPLAEVQELRRRLEKLEALNERVFALERLRAQRVRTEAAYAKVHGRAVESFTDAEALAHSKKHFGHLANTPPECVGRQQRKEVLFAQGRAGFSGSAPGPYKRARSKVRCP